MVFLPLSSEFKGWVLFSAVDKMPKVWEGHPLLALELIPISGELTWWKAFVEGVFASYLLW